jgi:hypothetical protein
MLKRDGMGEWRELQHREINNFITVHLSRQIFVQI